MDLGGDGSDGARLVELLAGAGRTEAAFGGGEDEVQEAAASGGCGGVLLAPEADQGCDLVDVLSRPMLREVLRIEADTTVALMYGRQRG